MKKLIIFTTVFTLFLTLFLPFFVLGVIDMVPGGDQPGYGLGGRVSVYGERDFSQEFVARDNNLAGIGTTIKNPNLGNKQNIIFNLYEDGNLIRSSILNGKNIGDGDFVKFVFDPIADSKNNKYKFVLSSPDASENEVVELFLIKATEDILSYSYDGVETLGGIPMVTYYKPKNKLEIIRKVYSTWLSKLL